MEFSEVIRLRRSCRRFTSEIVPESVIKKAIDDALLAPNSSNMQVWRFFWVRTPAKKAQLAKACLSQPAATTAQELVAVVAKWDDWNRNRKLIIEDLKTNPKIPKQAYLYYEKLMPLTYRYGPFNLWGYIKKIILNVGGIFRAVPRGPSTRAELFEMMTKSAALASENLMLSIYDQGYACCPMEGFDHYRVRKLLNLNRHSHVVMVIGIGRADPAGIWGKQFRLPKNLVVHEV